MKKHHADREKPFVLITGMHRSGTSFLARALNLSGVYLGEPSSFISNDWIPLEDNPRGHWENKEILTLTKKIFAYSKGSWDNLPKTIRLNANIRKKIKKCINELNDNSLLASGFKDPRIIFLFDSWKKYLPKNFVIIGIFRHPLKVAESLKKRDDFTYEKSLNLWKNYNENLLILIKKCDGFLLDFDWPQRKLLSEIKLISHKLGLAENIDLSEWYTKKLFRSDKTFNSKYKLSKEILNLNQRLKNYSKKNKSVHVRKFVQSKKLSSQLINELLSEGQNQGNYFKKLYTTQDQIIKHKDSELIKRKKDFEHSIKEKHAELTKWKEDYENRIKGKDAELTKWKEDYENRIKGKDAELTKWKEDYENRIKEKDAELTKWKEDSENRIKEKDAELTKWKEDSENRIKEKDAELTKLKEDSESRIKEKDAELTKWKEDSESRIKEKDAELTKWKEDYENRIKEKDAELTKWKEDYENRIKEKDAELTKLKEEEGRIRDTLTKAINQI